MAIDKIFNDGNVDGIADNIFNAVNNSVSEVKQMQQRKAAENAQMVVQSLKKIDTDIRNKFDNVTDVLEKRIITIKDGRDGSNGKDGRDGKDGKAGRDGINGKQGIQGPKGQDGIDGLDGVSVANANIDFDGSLIIALSNGTEINVGEVVSTDLQERIKVITSGGAGGSGSVTSVATGTGLSGGPITTTGTIALANTAVTAGTYTAANITVDAQGRITAAANGSGGGGGTVTSVALSGGTTGLTVTGSPITTSGTITLAGTLAVANGGTGVTTSTGSGNNVLSTSPTFVTPILGTPTSATLTNATGLPISTGVSGLGTGIATSLAVNVGTAGAPVVNGGALGTPSSGTATNLTGLPLSTGVTGTLPIANGGTGTATPSLVQGTNVTITGTWPNQTIASTAGGTGTVTSASVVSANGFAGTVATATTTPAITLTTSITGVLKGNGTAISAATAGTDYVAPSGALGTPSSGTATNLTGLPLSTGVTGTLPIANGGTNSTATATAGGAGYGTGTAHAYTAAGTAGQFLQSNGASAPTWVAAPSGGFTLGSPVATTSGTSIDFTGIPSGTKQIIITFKGVSTNGTDPKFIQIGDSGGIEISDYSGSSAGISETAVIVANSSLESFNIKSTSASDLINGSVILTLENSSTFTWVASGVLENSTSTTRVFFVAGRKSLSAVLDRVRLTTQNGTDTFDAGEVNIAYI